jgi:membrane protein required for colicin V production
MIAFSLIDAVFILILGILVIRGALRGFVIEISTMAAPILGVFSAVLFSNLLTGFIELLTGLKNSIWNHIIAFLVIFLIAYLCVFFIQGILQNVVIKLELHNLDRVLGSLLGFIEGILVIAIILILAHWIPFEGIKRIFDNSFFFNLLKPFIPSVYDILNMVPLKEACLKI